MQDLVESTWRWRDAGTPMRRRRRIVSGEIMEFLDFSPVSPRPRKTLKGVVLRVNQVVLLGVVPPPRQGRGCQHAGGTPRVARGSSDPKRSATCPQGR